MKNEMDAASNDEGGLRAPPELTGWRKAWWWFDFIILVKLARLRFIAILVAIGIVITQWDRLAAYYDKWTRPAESAAVAAADVEYFCPMHPTVIRDNPKDKCPICFMPLSKRKKGGPPEALPAGIVNRVQFSPYRMALGGIQTSPVDYVPLTKEITAVGFVEFNERGQRTVSARVTGRIDELYANETGQLVKAGDDLAQIYSPELFSTAQTLIDAKRRGNRDFLESSRERLKLLGIDDGQIEEILASAKAEPHLKIRAPVGGHIITKYVREGQYVDEGAPLYDVADLSTVWIQAQLYEDDLVFIPEVYRHGAIQPGEKGLDVTATTKAFPGDPFRGRLAFIYPHVDEQSRTVTLRFELDNPDHKLRPGSTATIKLKVQPQDLPIFAGDAFDSEQKKMLAEGRVLAVPESAVIDTGSQRIVYRESSPGVFDGVEVSLGPRMNGPDEAVFYPVLHGLQQGEQVVTSGSFLVDAETRLNVAAGSTYFGGSSGSKSSGSKGAAIRPSTPDDPATKIEAALAKLSTEDRKLAEAQKWCPVLDKILLGSMGMPIKLQIEGQPVFICCNQCKEKALGKPQDTLRKVEALKKKTAETSLPAGESTSGSAEAEIRAELAKLSPTDRQLAEAQRFCAVESKNRLGSMGPPVRLMIEGQPVFICCEGCQQDALANPQETLAKVNKLKQLSGSKQENMK